MNKKFIYLLVLIAFILNIICIVITIKYQHSLMNNIDSLKNIIVHNSAASVSNAELKEFSLNLSYYKDLWFNTIINQGGISIIFTLIILLITLTTGYFMNQNFDNKFKSELDKLKIDNENGAKDLFNLIKNHIGSGKIIYMRTGEEEYERLIGAINGFEELNIYKTKDFEELYNSDIKEFSKIAISLIIYHDEGGKVHNYTRLIRSKESKINIMRYIRENYKGQISAYSNTKQNKHFPELSDKLEKRFVELFKLDENI